MGPSDVLACALFFVGVGLTFLLSPRWGWACLIAGTILLCVYWIMLHPDHKARVIGLALGVCGGTAALWFISSLHKRRLGPGPIAYKGKGDSGEGAYLMSELGGSFRFETIHFINTQYDQPRAVNNLRARIEYRHADGEIFVVPEALWISVPHEEFTHCLNLSPNKEAMLCVSAQNFQTKKRYIIPDTIQPSRLKSLKDGRWDLTITVKSDNDKRNYIGKGTFRIETEDDGYSKLIFPPGGSSFAFAYAAAPGAT